MYVAPPTQKCHEADRLQDAHPLLQQTPLSVNPFIDLPKPPTLPPNYQSLPSTLPPSILNSAAASNNPDLPAYVSSFTGAFAAHPSTIIAQNNALLEQIKAQEVDANRKVGEWEQKIKERELAERRRRAPGWLDRDEKILEPVRKEGEKKGGNPNLMDEVENTDQIGSAKAEQQDVNDLGDAMDRAFGRSEMG